MRVVIIHALPESIEPTQEAFQEIYPEAELITLFDEALFKDFKGELTPDLNNRMMQLINYAELSKADAIGLACSVFAPVVEYAQKTCKVPIASSYSPIVEEILESSSNIAIISGVPKTLQDSEYYLRKSAADSGKTIQTLSVLAEPLMKAMKNPDSSEYNNILSSTINNLPININDILLSQFSMSSSLEYLKSSTNKNCFSPAHSTAKWFKKTLS
jgi:hypothetical protein